jgi:hypothetical protein
VALLREALDCYAKMRHRLVEELGIDPGPELQAIHQVLLRDDLDRAQPEPVPARAAAVPAQLPLDVRGFTGRDPELARLDGILATAGEQPTAHTAVVISALWGTAGVGKPPTRGCGALAGPAHQHEDTAECRLVEP